MSHEVEEALAAGVIRHVRTADALAAYALIQTADARGMRNTSSGELANFCRVAFWQAKFGFMARPQAPTPPQREKSLARALPQREGLFLRLLRRHGGVWLQVAARRRQATHSCAAEARDASGGNKHA